MYFPHEIEKEHLQIFSRLYYKLYRIAHYFSFPSLAFETSEKRKKKAKKRHYLPLKTTTMTTVSEIVIIIEASFLFPTTRNRQPFTLLLFLCVTLPYHVGPPQTTETHF